MAAASDSLARDGFSTADRSADVSRQQALLMAALHQAPHFIGVCDAELTPVFINRAGRRMAGLAEDADISGFQLDEFFHVEDQDLIREVALPAVLRDGRWEGEARFRRFDDDGSVPVRWRSFIIRDPGGAIAGAATFTTDITERLEAETRLRESEARFHQLSDLAPVFIWFADPDGTVRHLNQRWYAYSGYTSDNFLEAASTDAIHPDDREAFEALWARSLRSGEPCEHEFRSRRADGVYRWLLARIEPLRGEDGAVTSWFGSAMDIDDRKQVEDALRESQSQVRDLLDSIDEGFCVIERIEDGPRINYRYLQVNPAFERISGFTDVVGRTLLDLLPDVDRRWLETYDRVLESGDPIRFADHLTDIDLHLDLYVYRTGEPEQRRLAILFRDVTEQRRSEQALARSEALFRSFAENSHEMLWIFDRAKDRVEYVSPAYERVWGEPPDRVWDQTGRWTQSIHADDRERVQAWLEALHDGDSPPIEYRIVRPDGSIRWLRDAGFVISDGQEAPRRLGGIIQDITIHDGNLVYLIGPANAGRTALERVLQGAGHQVKPFGTPRAFLDVAPALVAGCVLVDGGRLDESAIALPHELKARRIRLPVILTAERCDDFGNAVRAMRAGAADVLETPWSADDVLSAVASALADVHQVDSEGRRDALATARVNGLTTREREVLEGLIAGGTNKTIARDLGLSPRTVETHRARVMERLGAETLPEAVLTAAAAGLHPPARPAL